jgi:hypothetical protein
VFRAHILTCTVLPDTCSREKPCSSCAVVMSHFERPKEELFAEMDAAQPRSRCTYTRPGSATVGPQLACPLCEKTTHGGLGVFWKKFGYVGPAYCTSCSSGFRNHIIRQRRTRSSCSREKPCEQCRKILTHFPGDRDTVYRTMDDQSSVDADAGAADPKSEPDSNELNPFSHGAPTTGSGRKRSVDSPAGAFVENDKSRKQPRKKGNGPTATVGLLGMAITACIVGFVTMHPATTSTASGDTTASASLQPPGSHSSAQGDDGVCHGGELQPHMNQKDLEQCVGKQDDMCLVGCHVGFMLYGDMVCDQGQFRGAICVPMQEPSALCEQVDGSYYGYSAGSSEAHRHFDDASLDACSGPANSECDFKCKPGPSADRYSAANRRLRRLRRLRLLIVSLLTQVPTAVCARLPTLRQDGLSHRQRTI